jgi:hypothetical protein
MENNNPTPTPIPQPTPTNPFMVKVNEIKAKIMPIFKEVFDKVYKNKMLFWLFVSIFGFMLLLIIVGSIYKATRSGNGDSGILIKTTPSPISGFINTGQKIYDELTVDEDKLHIINDSFINYDIKQKRLNPPEVDFDISF